MLYVSTYVSQRPKLPKRTGRSLLREWAGPIALCKGTWAFIRQKRGHSHYPPGLTDFKGGAISRHRVLPGVGALTRELN